MWRDIFSYASNPEVFFDAVNLRSQLVRAGISAENVSPTRLDEALAGLGEELETSRATWAAFWSSALNKGMRAELLKVVIAQSAPLGLSLGAWIQCMSAPGVFEDEIHLQLLRLLADDVGAFRFEASRPDAFRLIARRHGLSEYSFTPRDLAAVRTIEETMFRLPGLICALSRRSDAFAPELVGFDLGFRSVGLLAAWRAAAQLDESPEWIRLDLSTAQGQCFPAKHTPLTLSRWVADRYGTNPQLEQRVCDGIMWLRRGLLLWDRDLHEQCCVAINPRLAMAVLMQERARVASVYHQDVKLEGKSIADWFKNAAIDPFPFVDAVGRSWLVRPGEPEHSVLLTNLLNGPMFRIFREEDLALIKRWIESLAQDTGKGPPEGKGHMDVALSPTQSVGQGDALLGPEPRTIREAYFLLQGRALAPRTRSFAIGYVRFWLTPSLHSIDKTDRSLPSTWSPGSLRTWLLNAHDKHACEFERQRDDEPPSREAVIEQTLQLAPLTLIDGAWLQGFTDVSLASTRIGSPLFNTYWDELGNGEYKINHPKIYREVLRAMSIELPPTGSRDFALDERLHEKSFRLPVYWLCLGKLPVTFKPEILGMNLAMELSGVGGSYRTARRFLKHYGFPTVFVDIHNTIDNVATGHSAWAADAIDAYMQTASDYADPEVEWKRVRTGYESLAPIVKRDTALDFFRKWAPSNRDNPLDGEISVSADGKKMTEVVDNKQTGRVSTYIDEKQ